MKRNVFATECMESGENLTRRSKVIRRFVGQVGKCWPTYLRKTKFSIFPQIICHATCILLSGEENFPSPKLKRLHFSGETGEKCVVAQKSWTHRSKIAHFGRRAKFRCNFGKNLPILLRLLTKLGNIFLHNRCKFHISPYSLSPFPLPSPPVRTMAKACQNRAKTARILSIAFSYFDKFSTIPEPILLPPPPLYVKLADDSKYLFFIPLFCVHKLI